MIKRKTVTISDNVFQTLYRVKNDQERLNCYDTIFKALFTNSPVKMSALSETVQLAVSCLLPELRKIQAQYNNRKAKKNSVKSTKGLLCPLEVNQIKPTLSNSDENSLACVSNYNNNIYNINNNNIYNNKQTNNKDDNDDAVFDHEKLEFFYKRCEEELERVHGELVKPEDPNLEPIFQKTHDLFRRLAKEKTTPMVNGEPMLLEDIFEHYLEVFRADSKTVYDKLQNIYFEFKKQCSRKDISNTYKYLVSIFYNLAI